MRAGRVAPALVTAALVAVVAACSSFGEDAATGTADGGSGDAGVVTESGATPEGGAACALPPCAAGACTAATFASGCGGWDLGGDSNVRPTCDGSRLRLLAEDTLDSSAEFGARTPSSLVGVRFTARLSIARWDGGAMFAIFIDGQPTAGITAITGPSNRLDLTLCSGATSTSCKPFTAQANTDILVDIDLSADAVVFTMDCVEVARFPGVTIPGNKDVWARFGKTDGSPIEGSLDALQLTFR